jgi:predicted ATPase
VLYKINAIRLIKKSVTLDEQGVSQLTGRIMECLNSKGRCVIACAGSPGSGKSTLARLVRKRGFLSIPVEKLFVVDDLKGPGKEKYSRKDLPALVNNLKGLVLLLFDYKAALYLKKADIGIIGIVSEKDRLSRLKNRSAWGYKKYRKKFYRVPPIPFNFKKENIYTYPGNNLGVFGDNV